MVSFITTTLTALTMALAASAAPADAKLAARKPDHWGTVAWGRIGFGACGIDTAGDALVAAVSPLLFDAEQPCGQNMVVTYGEQQVVVQVVDRCEECADQDLVVSRNAFQALAGNLTVGLITATWDFEAAL